MFFTSVLAPFKQRITLPCVLVLLISSVPTLSLAQNSSGLTLEVIDPYLEMRSGPGRGYPIFYVIEEGEPVVVLTRQPGWYEVLSANGRKGWVREAQIARTMQSSGEPADLPSVSYGDYLENGWQIGFATGDFSSGELKGADNIKLTLGYRPLSWLVLEVEGAKFYAPEVRGGYQNFNLVVEPISKWRISPALVYGLGTLNIESQPELEPLNIEDSSFNHYGLRVNYYIGRNFLVNAEYRWFDIDVQSVSVELEGWYLGFNTFF